jgi:hypothetical protein
MKTIPIKVSIKSASPDWNPIFNSIQVGPDDEAAGSFLVIYGNDSQNDSAKISLDWDEWDDLVNIVTNGSGNKYEKYIKTTALILGGRRYENKRIRIQKT